MLAPIAANMSAVDAFPKDGHSNPFCMSQASTEGSNGETSTAWSHDGRHIGSDSTSSLVASAFDGSVEIEAVGERVDDFYEEHAAAPLGTGCSSSVVMALRLADGQRAALKKMKAHCREEPILREVQVLRLVNGHPNVIRFQGAFRTEAPLWTLAFDCHPEDLWDHCRRSGPQDEPDARRIFKGLLFALWHISRRDVIHRDVKPENVLVSSEGHAVLTDFGLATTLDDEAELRKMVGTVGYLAPEVIRRQRQTCKVDTFGAGIVLYFLVTGGRTPFDCAELSETLTETLQCQLRLDADPGFDAVSRQCKELISGLICADVEARLGARAALAVPWLCPC